MLQLKMLTDDVAKRTLAQAYWAQNADGSWKYTRPELIRHFGAARGAVHLEVANFCEASDPFLCCPTPACGAPHVLASHQHYQTLRRAQYLGQHSKTLLEQLLCARCCEALRAKRREEAEKQERMRRDRIVQWLSSLDATRTPIRYGSANLLETFLISGMLRYSGDDVASGKLSAWDRHGTPYFGLKEDIREMYIVLQVGGWIIPDPNSRLDAFLVSDSGKVTIDALRVDWLLAPDAGGEHFDALPRIAHERVKSASREELHGPWHWVSLSALRESFSYLHHRQQFNSKGWTPAVQRSMSDLLREASLGNALKVVYKTMMDLSAGLKNRELPAYRVYNAIPGAFLRTWSTYRANGWRFTPCKRRHSRDEPFMIGYLFDDVLEGGSELFNDLTGQWFEQAGTPAPRDADHPAPVDAPETDGEPPLATA